MIAEVNNIDKTINNNMKRKDNRLWTFVMPQSQEKLDMTSLIYHV